MKRIIAVAATAILFSIGNVKSQDTIGAAASFLCMIHCVATPFIFIAQACSHTPAASLLQAGGAQSTLPF
jgi:hypothetical protein